MIMKKKILKVIIFVMCIMLTMSIVSNVYASSISGSFTGELGAVSDDAVNPIIKILSAILFVVRTVGVAVATVILIVIACKYMIASAGDRADIKKYAVSYVIGAIIMFGTAGIAGLLQGIITGAFNSEGGGEP